MSKPCSKNSIRIPFASCSRIGSLTKIRSARLQRWSFASHRTLLHTPCESEMGWMTSYLHLPICQTSAVVPSNVTSITGHPLRSSTNLPLERTSANHMMLAQAPGRLSPDNTDIPKAMVSNLVWAGGSATSLILSRRSHRGPYPLCQIL